MYNCVVVTMNSNEIDVNEWIVHNILLGFDHIFIYDDNSNPKIIDIIDELPINIKQHVTIYRLDSHYEINKEDYMVTRPNNLLYFDESIYIKHKTNKQRYLMNYFLKYHKNISKYCFFCDIDEFIYLKEDNTISEYLLKMKEYDIIYIPWIYYGTSYYIDKPDGLLIDNFRCHANFYSCGKSIINMNNIDEIFCIHKINKNIDNTKYYKYDRNSTLFTHPIHINHYITKSYKSVLRKKKEHCLGQTNDFYRDISHIIRMGIGNGLNTITKDHIMEKYVENINNILRYNLNENHILYDKYDKGIIQFNDIILSYEYINNNNNLQLIKDLLESNNVKYLQN